MIGYGIAHFGWIEGTCSRKKIVVLLGIVQNSPTTEDGGQRAEFSLG